MRKSFVTAALAFSMLTGSFSAQAATAPHGASAPAAMTGAGGVWNDHGRRYCRRNDGSTGMVVGGVVGGVLGHEVAGRGGDRTLGAILGIAGGALLGRAIDRDGARCR